MYLSGLSTTAAVDVFKAATSVVLLLVYFSIFKHIFHTILRCAKFSANSSLARILIYAGQAVLTLVCLFN